MTDESVEEPKVTEADGSFYQAYKREFLAFISFVEQSGQNTSNLEKISSTDSDQLMRYLNVLNRKKLETFPLIAKRIDESNPSFFDECIVENIWQIAEAIFMVGQYTALTGRGVSKYVKGEQARTANRVKVGKAKSKNDLIKDAIRAEVRTQNLRMVDSDKFASQIEKGVRSRLGVAHDASGYSRRSIQRQISAILKECEPL